MFCFVHQLFSVYKVTTGTKSFVSIILKLTAVPDLDNIHFLLHVTSSSALQLINGISNDLQILLKYFNGTAISEFITVSFAPSAATLPIRLDLYLNDEELSAFTLALLSV